MFLQNDYFQRYFISYCSFEAKKDKKILKFVCLLLSLYHLLSWSSLSLFISFKGGVSNILHVDVSINILKCMESSSMNDKEVKCYFFV